MLAIDAVSGGRSAPPPARDPAAAHLWALKAKEVSIPVPAVDALLKELEKDMTPGQVAAARDEAAAYRFIR